MILGAPQAALGPRAPGNQSRRFPPSRLRHWIRQPARFPIGFLEGESFAFPLPTVASLRASPSRTSSCDQRGLPPWNPRCFACANQPTRFELGLRSSLLSVEKPCPLRPRRTSSSNTLASSPGVHPSAMGAFGRLAAPLTKLRCLELLPGENGVK